jgi:translation initiation factor 4A
MTSTDANATIRDWDDEKLKLPTDLIRGIYNYGFEHLSTIQQLTIKPMSTEQDIIAQAQSGTGKTGAFLIGILQKLDISKKQTQCIILSPTRELATQTFNVAKELSMYMKVNIQLLIGGTSVHDDIDDLHLNCPHIVIGCTGRIYDMLKRRHIDNSYVNTLILDEADEMLSQGFKTQVYSIFKKLNQNVQVVLFSATMPPELSKLTDKFMRNPIEILVQSSNLSLDGITQYKVDIDKDEFKLDTLKDIFNNISLCQTIIYCNNINSVTKLYDELTKSSFSVQFLHSNMDNQERTKRLQSFKSGEYRVLISSDITARGIDIHQVSVVINYDFPKNKHTYLHRIGRSGRWGRKGLAINFVTSRNKYDLRHIEEWYKITIPELPLNFTSCI